MRVQIPLHHIGGNPTYRPRPRMSFSFLDRIPAGLLGLADMFRGRNCEDHETHLWR